MKIEDVIMMPAGAVVGRKIVSASFEEWITHVFDRSDTTRHSVWTESDLGWGVKASETVDFIARTFDEIGMLLRRFSESQVAFGLEYICNMAWSDIARTLDDGAVPWVARRKAIRALRKLYSDCFAIACPPQMSHLERSDSSPSIMDKHPLNGVCYMWWDVFPILGQPKNPERTETEEECLKVMEFALGLESDACRESALHGLGHWVFDHSEFVHPIIDRFIEANPKANPDLIAYARAAKEGNIQ